jgi:hypothetical protein
MRSTSAKALSGSGAGACNSGIEKAFTVNSP